MTYIYLVRHCEAMGNHKRLFQGSTDCDISEIGAIQLNYLKERFKSIQLDAIYSSPLIRAHKTAEAIADGKGLQIITRPNLRELHGGVVEGKPFSEALGRDPVLADAWNNHPQDFAPDGGEAMREAYLRIHDEITALVHQNRGKTIACATHGGVLRCLMCRVLYYDITRLKDVPWCENTAVTLLKVDDNDKISVEFFNDYSHVPPEYMPKRSRLVGKV
ncbi:MAG: histidine phosphatase family protein [Clostridia bacterium]|nr:histidine phosphatase family protein [Clostridia bacterium]